MLKKAIVYVITIMLSLQFISPTRASDTFPTVLDPNDLNGPVYEFFVSEEDRQADIQRQISETIEQTPSLINDEIMYVYVAVDNTDSSPYITPYTAYTRAAGQGNGGTIFENSLGSIHWKSSGGSSSTVSISVGLSAGPVTVGVSFSPGSVSTEAYAERSVQISYSQIGKPVMLYVRKNYEVVRYAVYTYNKYSGPSTMVLSHYQDYKTEYSVSLAIYNV